MKHFVEGRKEIYPSPPVGYFGGETLLEFEVLRQEALRQRKPSHVTALSQILHRQDVKNTWRPPSTIVYRNWLTYIAEEKSRKEKVGDLRLKRPGL